MSHCCPKCGREFETRRGLGVHHYHAHGEVLPNQTCASCGTAFHAAHDKKYCSEECRQEAVSFAGENNPNYRGGKETTECDICGDAFEYYPSEKNGVYCPDCVETEDWRDPPVIEGEDNPLWNGGKIELDCAVCGASVERYPSEITGEATVCSEECRREWLSESFTGDGHPNWKGGGNEPYGKGWAEIRRRALERDGHACVVCGTSSKELGRNPDVHHIVPVRAFVEAEDYAKEDAHHIDNVVSLCIECHRRADFGTPSRATLRSLIGGS